MDNSSSIKFGDFKQEERYKRLERNLKLAFVKQLELMKVQEGKYCLSPTWPSTSSIHPDGFDTTSSANEGPHYQTSKAGSDVVSSSLNLRRILKSTCAERKPMATSSVKKYPVHGFDKDRAIMPPPVLYKPVNSNDKNLPLVMNSKSNAQDKQCKNPELDNKSYSSSESIINSSANLQDISFSTTSEINDHKGYRNFVDWRVILNDRGELIIKGTLDCGRIGRSKPVVQRFSCTKVRSLYKHIYILNGNLVDNRRELPDYIRGKFYNGFPDDWENVYQLWRKFISEGSPITFRWPRHVTDSDDDLNSEVTDFTYFKQISHNKQTNFSNATSKNDTSLENRAKPNAREHQTNKTNLELSRKESVDCTSPKIHNTNKRVDDSGHSSEVRDISTSNAECATNNNRKCTHCTTSNCSNSNLKNTSYLYEIIREDKLRIILSNLGDKNCPPQYLDKFIGFIDCLRYILSYTPSNDCDANDKQTDILSSKTRVQDCQNCNKTISFTEAQETRLLSQFNIQNYNECVKPKEVMKYSEKPDDNVTSNCSESDDTANKSSNSDIYMGIPKVNWNRVLQSKIRQSESYKDIRSRKRNRNTTKMKQFQEQIECNKNYKSQYHNDSDIDVSRCNYNREQTRKTKSSPLLAYNNTEQQCNKQYDVEEANISANENNCATSFPNKAPRPVIAHSDKIKYNIKLVDSRVTAKSINDIEIINAETHNKKQASNFNKISNDGSKDNKNDNKLNEKSLQGNFLERESEAFENEEHQCGAKHSKNQSKNCYSDHVEKGDKVKNKKFKIVSIESQEIGHREPVVLLSCEEKKMSSNNKIARNEPFGSKQNPKLLASWTPCVVQDSARINQCHLTFEGKLLNEAGHVLNRKFVTDSILTRHSLKLVETVNNDYFMLVGDLANKNLVPKELLKLCLQGCPSKIDEFCQEWTNLKTVFKKTTDKSKLSDLSVGVLKVPTSSRGRPLIPPLNYWQGERITTKNFDTVYNRGNTIESSLSSKIVHKKPNSKKKTNEKMNESPKKRLKLGNESRIKSRKRKIVKRNKIDKTSSSTDVEDASEDEEFIPYTVNFTVPMNRRKNLRSHCNKQHPQKAETNYNMRTRTSTNNTMKLAWTYDKGEYVDVLSDDLASIR
ncbi:PREDICTED: uncharacterized protein LOC105363555 [Ceratosolen solmsi marchali]|uniref:Uncharacterized protein LOC105363555 n=1 Tax=Ceratosolen solmsi marchali TaxID=326594 RepID=A0AAJ7DX29_9HYME|nr:PREDICTED: uncharacterized protein LOC105363555 [Ceratosolen solmsi marchali]